MNYDITAKKLDKSFGSFLDKRLKPMYLELKNSLTLYKNTKDAFLLKPATSTSLLVSTNYQNADYDGGIIRCEINYELCKTWLEDEDIGKYYLSIIKNELLKKVSEEFILSDDSELTFKYHDTYFRSMENPEIYDLRLYFNKTRNTGESK